MDRINFEVLEDGAVRFSTDKISKKNHANADEFMEMMKDFIGESFITPFLLLEAEKDRNDLLVFCGKLAKKIGKDNESE